MSVPSITLPPTSGWNCLTDPVKVACGWMSGSNCLYSCWHKPLKINVELGIDPKLEAIRGEHFCKVNREREETIHDARAQELRTYAARFFFEYGDRKNRGVPYQALDGQWYAFVEPQKIPFLLVVGEIYEYAGKRYQVDGAILYKQNSLGNWWGYKDKRWFFICSDGEKGRIAFDGQHQRPLSHGQWFKITKERKVYRQLWDYTWQIQCVENQWATCSAPKDD